MGHTRGFDEQVAIGSAGRGDVRTTIEGDPSTETVVAGDEQAPVLEPAGAVR